MLDERSADAILNETGADLFAYDTPNLPEDWLFYAGDFILLPIITHEQQAILRISDSQHAEFKKLGIPHTFGAFPSTLAFPRCRHV